MRPELARLQYLERHLLGQAAPSDDVLWQAQLLLDPALHAEADAQQLLYRGIQLAGQRQLRRELDAIHERLYPSMAGRRHWVRVATASLRTALRRWARFR